MAKIACWFGVVIMGVATILMLPIVAVFGLLVWGMSIGWHLGEVLVYGRGDDDFRVT